MELCNDQKLNEFSVKTPLSTTIMYNTVFAPSNEVDNYLKNQPKYN